MFIITSTMETDGKVNPFASVFLQSVTNVEQVMMLEKVDSPQQHQQLEENLVVVVTV